MSCAGWRPHERHYTWPSGLELTIGQRTLVMGILNATPDSFSDGGKFLAPEAALRHALSMAASGADLLDLGGESTRPGSKPVPLQEELDRVLPVLELLKGRLNVPLSIDTYKPEVADQAMKHGAHMMNDVWGFRRDPEMAAVAARHGCPVILMHNREKPVYENLVLEVLKDLETSVEIAVKAGVLDSNIWLDPGIGFGKTYVHNLQLMRQLDAIVALGFPVLLGTSRKRFIRDTLELPADQVVEGTAATATLGIVQGCQIMRVHDVAEIKRTVRMVDAMLAQEE